MMMAFLKKVINKITDVLENIIDIIKNKTVTKRIKTNEIVDDEPILVVKEENPETLISSIDEVEDELDKTSVFRVISIDENGIDEKYKEEPLTNNINEENPDLISQFISVDSLEVDKTLLEIAEHEIKENDKVEKEIIIPVVEDEPEVEDETFTNINFDFLKTKKSKNIFEKIMVIKTEEINELIKIIMEENKKHVSPVTIKNGFITSYLNAKYYNDFKENIQGKNSFSKLKKTIEIIAAELIVNSKKNIDYENTVKAYLKTFLLIVNLDKANDSITDNKAKSEFYSHELHKYDKNLNNNLILKSVNEIKKTQKKYAHMTSLFLNSLKTNSFDLIINPLSSKKNMYAIDLNHNIAFNKVYSDYIINKVYTEGIIAEDKIQVLLPLLSIQLIEDMLKFNHENKYFLYLPSSLYSKEKKCEKTLKLIDDKYAKNRVFLLLSYDELLLNKIMIKKMRKQGYKFALMFKEKITVKAKDKGNVYMASYILIDKTIDYKTMIPSIPKEFEGRIIYEDLKNKIGGD